MSSQGILVLEEPERTRFLWRCAHVAWAWAEFSQDGGQEDGGTPLPLLRQLYREFSRMALEQDVTLVSTESEFLSKILCGRVGDWLDGGGDECILTGMAGAKWKLTPYGRQLLDSVKKANASSEQELAWFVGCFALIAVNWNEAGGRAEADRFWNELRRNWEGEIAPAGSFLELLVWPVSWWLDAPEGEAPESRGLEMAFLFVDDEGQAHPTPDAIDLVSGEEA